MDEKKPNDSEAAAPETPQPEPTIPDRIPQNPLSEDAIDALLAEHCGGGRVLIIHRLQPRWCQGYCDTWPLDDPVTLGSIKEVFGGRRFALRVHRAAGAHGGGYERQISVWIDDEPRRDGRIIRLSNSEFAEQRPIINPPGDSVQKELLAALQQANDRSMQLLTLFAERMSQTIHPAAAAAATGTASSALAETIAVMRQMKEFSSEFSGGGEEANPNLGLLMKLFEQQGQQQQQPAPPRTRRVFGPPRTLRRLPPPQAPRGVPGEYHFPQPAPDPQPAPGPQPTPGPDLEINPLQPENLEKRPTDYQEEREDLTDNMESKEIDDSEEDIDIIDFLAEMDPAESAEVLAQYIKRMGPQRSQKVFELLMSSPSISGIDTSQGKPDNPIDGGFPENHD